MLHPLYYIGTVNAFKNATGERSGIVALQSILASVEVVNEAYKLATDFSQIQFCFAIDAAQGLTPELATAQTAFFFLPIYHTQQNIPVVVVHGDLKKFDATKQLLETAAQAQGFNGMQMIAVTEDFLLSSTDAARIKSSYRNLLETATGAHDALFVKVESADDIKHIEHLLLEAETTFQKSHAVLFHLKAENKKLVEALQQSQTITTAATQEIETLQSHITTLQSQSPAAQLQHYYTNEYEVLPLWYKRIGHLLKVLRGKRSLRSLFTPTEKKYNP